MMSATEGGLNRDDLKIHLKNILRNSYINPRQTFSWRILQRQEY